MADTSLVFNILARDRASKTFDSIKAKAAVAGTAIGVALSTGLSGALEKSKTDALLAAQLGAGPELAATLGKASGDLYSRGVVDSVEAGNAAIKGAIQNALVPKDAGAKAIAEMGAMVSNMATILEADASQVSATVSQMLRTGMAKSAQEAFDILAAGAQNGADKAGDLLDTFNEYPTLFRNLGLSGQQAMGLISQGLQAGARDSDKVADALKEFSIRAVDGSKTTADGFAMLGLSADTMAARIAKGGKSSAAALQLTLDRLRAIKDPVKQSQAAVALFGTQAEDLGRALYALDPSKAVSALGNVSGAAQRAGDTLEQSAGAKVESLKRKLEVGLTSALGTVSGFLLNNTELVKGLGIVLGPIVGIIAAIVAAVKVWTVVQTALNVVLSANPIGLVVLAIGALIAILVLAWNHSETFRKIVTAAWNAIWGAVKAVGSWFVNTLWPWIKGVWDKIASSVVGLKNKIVSTWNSVISFFKGLPGKIASIGARLWEGIKNGFRAAINWIIGRWNSISFGIPRIDTPFGSFGGGTFRVPQIPYLAAGGVIQRAGMAVVGEAGPELLSLPRGAQVTPLNRASGGGGAGEVTVRLVADGADSDMLRLIRKMVRVEGQGNVQVAFGR